MAARTRNLTGTLAVLCTVLISFPAMEADAIRLHGNSRQIARGDLSVTFPPGRHGPIVRFRDCAVFRHASIKVRSGDYRTSYFDVDRLGARGTTLQARETEMDGNPAIELTYDTPAHDYRATLRYVLEDERTLLVEWVHQTGDLEGAFIEFVPLVLQPNPIMGRVIEAHTDGDLSRLLIPLKPRPHDERFFPVREAERMTIFSRVSTVELETIGETPGIGLVDFRASQYAGVAAMEAILLHGRYRLSAAEQRLGIRLHFADPREGPEPTPEMLAEARMVPQPPPDPAQQARQIVPAPQQAQWRTGACDVAALRVRVAANVSPELLAHVRAIPLATGNSIERDDDLPPNTITIGDADGPALSATDLPEELQPWQAAQSYRLEIEESRVVLSAPDEAGLWNGWLTLAQLSHNNDGSLPRGSLTDWPELQFRGYHMNLRVIHPNLPFARALISLMARLKYTHVVTQFQGDLELESHPQGYDPDRYWTKEQIRSLVAHAQSLGVELVPEMKLIGHAAWAHGGGVRGKPLDQLPQMQSMFDPGGTSFCPQSEQAAGLARAVIDEVVELFDSPPYFHISGDEAHNWAGCDRCADEDAAALLADWIGMLHERVSSHGCRTMMWGDMLLAPEDYPGFNAAHALRGTERALEDLPRDIVITDWHYSGNDQFPSARYFQQQGFDVIGCPWNSEQGILNWGEQLAADDALGLLGTSWHKLTDILGTIALVSEAAWNSDGAREVAESYDTSAFVVASLERLMSEHTEFAGNFRPIDLSAHANVSFSDEKAGDGRDWLDFGPLRDLRGLQPGRHTFSGVPFEVPAGEANAIMLHSPLPPCDNLPHQAEGIPVDAGATRLHLLTGYGFHVPGRPKVLTVRLNYATGEPEDVPLQAGRDIFHWLAEGLPAAGRGEHRTTVAWRGRARDGTPVRLCTLAIDVDRDRQLESIDLTSHDTEAAPFVAALTVEHAGD